MRATEPLLVLYDADCALCRRCRAWAERRATPGALAFIACGSPAHRALCPSVDHLACCRALMVVRPADGRVWTAHMAVARVVRAVPRWRRLAPALEHAPLRPLAAWAYRLVAAGRRCA